MAEASRDQNRVTTLLGVSNADGVSPVVIWADPTTHRLLVDLAGGAGTVTSVSVVSANGFAGTVATATTTPAISLSTTITGILKGNGTAISAAVSNTDYQAVISLTTTGTSGAATFNGTTLNIPNYATSGGTPGGSTTQVQYNNAGAFGGITGATTNGTTLTLVAPVLGTPSSGTLTNATGLPISSGVSGLGTGIATALAVNTGSAGAPVLFNGALGTPASGTVTNLTGTASININGTVGATTPGTGAFTTLSASSAITASTTIELGHASDTTLSRSAAGVLAVEGVVVPTISSTSTLTNKRNQPRTASSTTAATLAPDLSSANVYYRTTQTEALTVSAPIGTPVIGETIAIYVDSVGAQTLTMNATYKVFGAAFPATTTAGKTFMATAQFNGTDWKTTWANAI